ncbi:hypothetical protein PR048_029011 [Dryococelus australis]|uniref:Uncharacterized protein n=1 Tax=Dryococelus australis TaxID=614101 RepID=A0ABQ9GC58_9NEOP|nr:hypothetical protein PR048_029011 [Dryococelus australis]
MEGGDYGFKVVTIVNDMGGGNLSLWKHLQISTNKVSFTNPVDVTRKVRVHLNISGSAQQKVKFATQLFSHHTATLLKRKFPQKPQI